CHSLALDLVAQHGRIERCQDVGAAPTTGTGTSLGQDCVCAFGSRLPALRVPPVGAVAAEDPDSGQRRRFPQRGLWELQEAAPEPDRGHDDGDSEDCFHSKAFAGFCSKTEAISSFNPSASSTAK